MKRLCTAIFVFVCFTNLFPQTYYVSSSSGNDNNNGLSESSPWKTTAKVNSKTFKPGDNILFKKGDIWIGEQLIIDHGGTAGNQITYSSFGTGLKPIITTKDSLPGGRIASNWTVYSSNIWVMSFTNTALMQRLWLNGTEAKLAVSATSDNLDGTTGVCATHQFYSPEGGNKIYLYATSNPASAYSSIEIPGIVIGGISVGETVSLRNANYVILDGLDIQGGMRTSIGINGSNHVTVTNCNIGKYSNNWGLGGDNQMAAIKVSNYVTISNNTIDSDWDYDYLFYTKITPTGIVMGNGASYWDVNNNYTKDWWVHFFVIAKVNLSQYHEIYNNESTNPNFIALGYPAVFSSSPNYLYTYVNYYNNYCHDFTTGIELASAGNKIFNNIFEHYTHVTNVHAPSSPGWGLSSFTGTIKGVPDSNYIFNNTWYDMEDFAILEQTYGKHFYYNNLFVYTGHTKRNGVAMQNNYGTGKTYKNNLFYHPSFDAADKMIYPVEAGTTKTDTEFNAYNGTNGYTISGNLQYVGSLSTLMNVSNFSLPTGSPALNAGIDISSLVPEGFTDRFGNVVDRKNPNIGAVDNSKLEPTGFNVYLQGSFVNGKMKTDLKDGDLLPKSQPYNILPWNYTGDESVSVLPSEIVDWVLVELRSDISSSSIAAKRAAFVKSDGNIVDLDGISKVSFNGVNSGNYYIVIRHRNHLSIMSANKVALNGSFLSYDFTTSRSTTFGNDLAVLGNGKYGMYAGDGDANGTVNVLDYGTVGNNLFQTGYLAGDYDLNGTVNVLDYAKTNQNLLKVSNVP